MKMKNVLMILISLALVFTMAGCVCADGSTISLKDNFKTSPIYVNYTVEGNYTVTIPAAVTFADGSLKSEHQVNATNVMIGPGKKLNVTMTASNPVTNDGKYQLIVVGGSSSIPYYINKTESAGGATPTPVENETVILSVPAGKHHPILYDIKTGVERFGDYITITFETTKEFIAQATESGIHTDTLTFTVSVEP